MPETLNWFDSMIREGCSGHVVTANAEILYHAYKNPALLSILNNAALVTADGSGVLWAAKYLGHPIPGRVTGVDLLQGLLPLAEKNKWRVFFLGAAPLTLEEAVLRIRESYPGLNIAGAHHGYFSKDEESAVAEEIRQSQTQILFAGMGFPRQEEFIAKYLSLLGTTVAMGVGGSFDILAGKTLRAPLWMSDRGLEWLYRLIREPTRAKRMTALPKFVFEVLKWARNTAKK